MAWYDGTKATRAIQQEKEEEGKERKEIWKERRRKEKEEVTERSSMFISTFVQKQPIVSTQTSVNLRIKYRF